MSSERKIYRDAITGEYVTEEYAAKHPDTTIAETVPAELVEDQPPAEEAD